MENINVKKGTRKSFVLYTSYADQIKLLNESEKAMLLDAIFEYQLTGELSVELCPMVAMAFSFMKRNFDADFKKYEKKCERLAENIKNKSKKEDTLMDEKENIVIETQQIDTISCRDHTDIVGDNDNENDNDNDNENDNVNDNVNDSLSLSLSHARIKNESALRERRESESEGGEKKELDDLFERFWEAYPRKQDKLNAHAAWVELSPDKSLFERIMDSLERTSRSEEWKRDGGRFIPMASKWLSCRRWEDSPPPEKYEVRGGGVRREKSYDIEEWSRRLGMD